MPLMDRLLVNWSGAGVNGLAVNVLHFNQAENVANPLAVSTAYTKIRTCMPVGTSTTINNNGDTIEATTGELTTVWAGTGGGTNPGTATFNPAAGVGACVTWITGVIIAGHRVTGRTFLVPLSVDSYDTSGTLTEACKTAIGEFATELLTHTSLAVWHRPTSPGASDGAVASCVGYRLRDKVAILTSRRD